MQLRSFAAAAAFVAVASAGSITDIKHIVLFMQENRAFDHYFGTMAGVRGFADPNVQVNPDGLNTFQQPVTSSETNDSKILNPWYLNYLGGDWPKATQCMGAGDNSWQAMHAAYNGGLTNQWVATNTPWTWGYFKREDIPVHFNIAEGWTVADMYQEAILAATDPNRVIWMSGTVNNPGTNSNPNGDGGMILDDNATPGCESPHLNCVPFTWKTFPEYWQAAGVSWQVYQDFDNFEDNMLAYFEQYEIASDDSPLTVYGNSYPGLDKFYADAQAGTLPQISYIIGPGELSEHYPYLPSDGAWLQKQVVDAVTSSPIYNETVLMISYDEVGGYGDHVTPYHAPSGTAGEWINDPYGEYGYTPVGPGFRIPFYIISPWTRGGNVFTEHADHNSQIMFVEEWLEAQGYTGVHSFEMSDWRREHMSNLVNAFDFDHHRSSHGSSPSDYSGNLTLGSLTGNYIGAALCQATYPTSNPPVPYGSENANQDLASVTEQGFKAVRGNLTEGRFLTFEMNGYALTNTGIGLLLSAWVSEGHSSINQRWVLHQLEDGGNTFTLSSSLNGQYIVSQTWLENGSNNAETFTITFEDGLYYLQVPSGQYLSLEWDGQAIVSGQKAGFNVYSVTYH